MVLAGITSLARPGSIRRYTLQIGRLSEDFHDASHVGTNLNAFLSALFAFHHAPPFVVSGRRSPTIVQHTTYHDQRYFEMIQTGGMMGKQSSSRRKFYNTA